ncbi:MAG: glycosyltransferase family 4 protein [Planctomycetaceae bacterium]
MQVSQSTTKPVIGVVAWHALPAVYPARGRSIGGIETGAWTLARALARTGQANVKFFLASDKAMPPKQIAGVLVIPHVNRIEAIRRQVSACIDVVPKLRLKRWDFKLIWQVPLLILSRPWRQPTPAPMSIDQRLAGFGDEVDIWFGFGANGDTARLAATATSQHRPMVLFIESNADLEHGTGETSSNAYGESPAQQRYALQHASLVVCQSQWQFRRFQDNWHQRVVLIRNPIALEDWKPKKEVDRDGVLWIGRYDHFHKRTHLAIEIAKLCSDIPFTMIINRGDSEVEKHIRRICPPNVTIIDYVSYDEIASYFQSAKVFLSTGHPDHEGFPNVLLESAASQTPIVAMFDFDEFLKNSGAGMHSDDSVSRASELIKRYYQQDPTDWDQVTSYLLQHHSDAAVVATVLAMVESELHQAS